MKRISIFLFLVTAAGTVFAGVIAIKVWTKPRLIETITSPDGTFQVFIKGAADHPIDPITTNWVYFDLSRRQRPVVANKFFHSGDLFDPSFNDLYRDHNWVTNSVLRFSNEGPAPAKCDSVIVRNQTQKSIAYLHILSKDLFLVFDFAPQSEARLCAFPQKSMSWLTVEGEFTDGALIPFKGTNFIIDYQPGPFEYEVVITPDGPKIVSSKLSEYHSANESTGSGSTPISGSLVNFLPPNNVTTVGKNL